MTVKTQDGKVILKNGKVACSCCEILCPDRFDIEDPNTFEITKDEFLAYYGGGTWTINVDEVRNESAVDIRETPPTPNSVSATAQFEFSFEMAAFTPFNCQKIFNYSDFYTDITLSGTRFVPGGGTDVQNISWGTTFIFNLTNTNGKYYAKYFCSTRISSSSPPGGIILNQPTTMAADGNSLISNLKIGDIYSAILYQDGDPIHEYENNSTSFITITFSPS